MKKKGFIRITAMLMASVLLCTACGGSEGRATTMYLMQTVGTVEVANEKGKAVEVAEQLKLYSGYDLDTAEESYAWINLDNVKLTKMDEKSAIEIHRFGKTLEIQVISGSFYFHVTEPLAEDETMNIRTSTTMIGIRGTCGWVTVDEHDHLRLYMLEGTVQYDYEDPNTGELQSMEVSAGQTAELIDMGDGTFRLEIDYPYVMEIPLFIQNEVLEADVLMYLEELGIAPDFDSAGSGSEPDGNSPSGAESESGAAGGSEEGGTSESGATESESTPQDVTQATMTMPVTASEIFSELWSGKEQTLTVESGGEETTLEIDFMSVPEGKTLILGEGINVTLVYPEDFEEKASNLDVMGNMVINGNLTTDEGELMLESGTLQVNGSVTLGAAASIIMSSNIRPDVAPKLIVTEGIVNYGSIYLYRGTIEADIAVKAGSTVNQFGDIIGEISYEGGSLFDRR